MLTGEQRHEGVIKYLNCSCFFKGTCPERWTLWCTTCPTRTLAASPTLRSGACLNKFVSWERYVKWAWAVAISWMNPHAPPNPLNSHQWRSDLVAGDWAASDQPRALPESRDHPPQRLPALRASRSVGWLSASPSKLFLTHRCCTDDWCLFSGTGKTLLARAVASQLDCNFLKVSVDAIIQAPDGSTEQCF